MDGILTNPAAGTGRGHGDFPSVECPHLTSKEFGLLCDPALHRPKPRSRPALYLDVWGMPHPSEGSLKTVDVHVRRVRLKLGWRSDRWLLSVSGLGYCLVPPKD